MNIVNELNTLAPHFKEIIQQAKYGITITDPNKKDNPLIYVNNYFCEMFGYEYNEVIGKNCRFLQSTDKEQDAIKDIKNAIKEEEPISRIVRNYKKDGTLVYSEVNITPIVKNNKVKFFLGIQKDLTFEKDLSEKIKNSETLSNLGYWELDLIKNNLYWSDQIFSIFEINKNQFTASYDDFLKLIHPDDKKLVNDAYLNSLETKKKYSLQHRLLMNDGRVKYVEERCHTYFDKNGTPIKSVGTIQDITQIKEIEIELENTLSLAKSYKLAMDESSMVSKADLKGNITYINDNFCRVSKYTKDELIGKPHNIVRHPDNPKDIFKDLWKTIKSKKIWKKILKNIDKYGQEYWVDMTILPIIGQDNNISEYIAIRHDITETINQKIKLDNIANTDLLTGLYNRHKLYSDINVSILPALAIINIDRFTEINDFYGHALGDCIIKEFSQKLLLCKNSDCYDLYHLQGDEFVIFNNNISQNDFLEKIYEIEQKLRKEKISINNDFINLDFSIAISFETKEALLRTADMALKVAKKTNKDILIYSDEISKSKEYENNIKWSNIVKVALKEDKVIPVFQALVNNKTMKHEKYEALVRIKDKDKLISPFYFLNIAKKTRHYTEITKTMIEKTFELFKDREEEFSINLTIEDILNEEIKEFILKILQKHKIGNRLVFEIVESESIENFEDISKFIVFVKGLGCKIAIDDFGTGYSNFEYLVKLKADYIKIDGSLIKDIDKNPISEIVCKNIVNFAKDLNMKTIAEFVENEKILEKVKAIGVDYSQGYYFSEPKEII
ncbi:bifunctional diguanylate cyclase/phosphodiesterase [Poseidonibacter sp.]|uniref:bifunctional diguanylate cyclase/phosphodiesterase n=1 Tax=Poseidonibacter sp. TaxID=2321188 RepID=UPI003C77B77E